MRDRSKSARVRLDLLQWVRGHAVALAAAWRELRLFDAARAQPSWQSSYRRAHYARAVARDGSRPNLRFRATDLEESPWWMVELRDNWPIHVIRIFNRTDKYAKRAARLTVSISTDKQSWLVVHSGTHYFGGEVTPAPLEIHLLGEHAGRYVRIDLPERGILSVRRVEVLVERWHRGSHAPQGKNRGARTGAMQEMTARLQAAARRWRNLRAQAAIARQRPDLIDLASHGAVRHFPATGQQANPQWIADLGRAWPIHALRIHKRTAVDPALASRLVVSLSADGQSWDSVLAGVHFFGDSNSQEFLEIRLSSLHAARFVRLELPDAGALSLLSAEILVEHYLLDLRAVCDRYRFDFQEMIPARGAVPGRPKYLVTAAPQPFDGTIAALHVSRAVGRFGNHLKVLMVVTCLARRLGIKRIYLTELSEFSADQPIDAEGLIIQSERLLAHDRPGPVLAGPFFVQTAFGEHLQHVSDDEEGWAVRHVIRPLFLRTVQKPPFVPADTDLSIHIRSGDLFSNPQPHSGYVQPPLAFYQLILRYAQRELGIRRVILGYENDLNPCIPALKQWLQEIGVPFVTQSASLAEDLSVQLHARHCVYGYGSFGPAIVRLSERMRTVFMPWTMMGTVRIARIAGVRLIFVRDVAGKYIARGNWKGTAEQRRMMLDYPIENLALDEAASAAEERADFAGGLGG